MRQAPNPLNSGEADLAAVLAAVPPAVVEQWAAELPAEQLAVVERVLANQLAAGWRAHPAAMLAHLDAKFRLWRYIEFLSGKFVEAVSGVSPRQIWNLPSRFGKTTLLRGGIAWGLDARPESRWIYTTYGQTLAYETSVWVRDFLRVHADVLQVALHRDRQRGDRFVTEQGGGLLGAGMNASIVGFGCGDGGGLLIDDPMKNWQEAHSQAARNRVWDQYRGTLRHRLDSEDAPIIVVHARWHRDDLSGRLQEASEDETGEPFEVVALPALAATNDPLGRAPGEPIEPERFPLEEVQARHHALGSYLSAALEQQDPAPPEGKELLREWFVLAEAAEMPHQADRAITSWDLKLKDNESGDYVVGQCWWEVAGAYWLVGMLRGRFDHAATANAIALLSVRHPEANTHFLEYAGSAPEVIRELRKPRPDYVVSDAMAARLAMTPDERTQVAELRRRGMGNLQPNTPKGDKSVRARASIAPNAEPGLVRLPADAPWTPALLDELAAFPDEPDDQVDAMSQALLKLARGHATAQAPTAPVPGRGTRPAPTPPADPARPVRGSSAGVSVPVGRLRPRSG